MEILAAWMPYIDSIKVAKPIATKNTIKPTLAQRMEKREERSLSIRGIF
jgi:hypothetical protein